MLFLKKKTNLCYNHKQMLKSFLILLLILFAITFLKRLYINQQYKLTLGSKIHSSRERKLNYSRQNKIQLHSNITTRQFNDGNTKFVPKITNPLYQRINSNGFSTRKQLSRVKFMEVNEFHLKDIEKYYNEDTRAIGFPVNKKSNEMNKVTKTIYLATKYFNEWNPKHYYFLHLGNSTFTRYSCPIAACYATNKPSDIYKSDAVLFHVRDLEVSNIPSYRTSKQIWILYSMEPPWLEIKDMRLFNGVFNWTMSYRKNSDVLLKYGFVGKKKKINIQIAKKSILNDLFHLKTNKAIWYVSNCQSDSNREEYVRQLRKIYPVDIIGGCGRKGCLPAETKKCYTSIENRYKFYLAFENALCPDYVTEKLFNSLEYDIIPVTFGGVNYSDITPNNSIIDALKFRSPKELGKYLWRVSQNKTLYLSYFEWKDSYRSYLQPWMCDLCEKLHNPISYKTNNDLQNWWNDGKSCQRWSATGLKPVKEHVFPKYHIKLYD